MGSVEDLHKRREFWVIPKGVMHTRTRLKHREEIHPEKRKRLEQMQRLGR